MSQLAISMPGPFELILMAGLALLAIGIVAAVVVVTFVLRQQQKK